MLKLVLNIEWFLMLCCLDAVISHEMCFWATSRFRKGFMISFQKLYSSSFWFKNKNFNICYQFQHLTTCRNDMMHSLVKYFINIVKKWKFNATFGFLVIRYEKLSFGFKVCQSPTNSTMAKPCSYLAGRKFGLWSFEKVKMQFPYSQNHTWL